MKNSILFGTYTQKAHELLPYDMILEYYLIEEHLCEEYSELKRYGITIKKTAVYPDGKTLEESKTVNDVFYKKKTQRSLSACLSETPLRL